MNPAHVEIVKRGKEAIDRWREANPGQQLNLSRADLSEADLSEADLSEADLSGADLHNSFLAHAELSRANLTATKMSGINLMRASLTGANLSSADLSRANLSGANLTGANLFDADLTGCLLVVSCLEGAELTGAKLFGSARDRWNIKGVKCLYVRWGPDRQDRSPRDRDLELGEFEQLYAQLPTIEYIFENGMTPLDPLVMDRIVQAINEQIPEFDLKIDSINARGLQPTITFTVQQEDQKAPALEAVTQGYDDAYASGRLHGANEALSGIIDQMIQHGMSGPVTIGSGSNVALGPGSSLIINTEEYIGHLEEIEQAIKDAPVDTLAESAKQEALDIVSGAVKDVARGKAKEAAEAITSLGVRVGTSVIGPQALEFFRNLTT